MLKRRWLVVGVLVGVLSVGAVGGTVLAQGDVGSGEDSPLQSFASRVAAILGLNEEQVEAALTQASGEMRDEAMQSKMARLVEEGRITRQQADEYLEWQRARPDSLQPGFGPGFRGHGFHRGRRFGGGMRFHGPGRVAPPAAAPDTSEATSL